MISVIFCGLKYDYGKPENGLAYEYRNFCEVMKDMSDVKVEEFCFDIESGSLSKEELNNKLLRMVEERQPDLLFCFLFKDQISEKTIEKITKKGKTKTFNWFADDHWRVFNFSRFYAPAFTLVGTTDFRAFEYYKKQGITNVILTQWAVNPKVYKPFLSNDKLGITFVGQNFGRRQKYIDELENSGIEVEAFGGGFKNGRVSYEKMVEIFSNSAINLNFTEISKIEYRNAWKIIPKFFMKKRGGRYSSDIKNFGNNFKEFLGSQRRMIKGRNFEVPACGGFLLSGYAEHLEDFYFPGKEIVVFESTTDLIDKCRYYLNNVSERQKIADAGYIRTLKEHTYEHRLRTIFAKLGFTLTH